MSGNEIGATGLNAISGGTVQEGYNPKLQGRSGILIYQEMSESDPIISSFLYTIDSLVRQVKWHTEEGTSDEKGMEFLDECRDDMSHSWSDLISEVMSMIVYGFAFNEIVYKRRRGPQSEAGRTPTSKFNDGKVGWHKMPIRSQDSLDEWRFSDSGSLEAFVQNPPPKYEKIVIPIQKGLLFRTRSFKGNPEGASLLRGAYRPWYFKKRIEEIEGTGIERDLAGFPVIDVPASYLSDDASNDEKAIVAAFREIGSNLRRDKQEYLIMPQAYNDAGNKLFDLRLMSAAGARSFDTSAIIGRYDQRIAMTVLADFILLGHEKVGSFALSSDKTDLFAVALGTILDTIEDVFNRFAIPRLWRMNGMDESKTPLMKHGDIEDPDLAALGTFLQTLSGLGMQLFPDDGLEDFLRNLAHIPEKSDEAKAAQEERRAEGAPEGAPEGGAGDAPGQADDGMKEGADGTIRFEDSGSAG